jgi:hypothetical protein
LGKIRHVASPAFYTPPPAVGLGDITTDASRRQRK